MSILEVKQIQAPTGYDLQMPAGHIVQVVESTTTTESTQTSTSWGSCGLTASITPTNASNKIYISANVPALFLDTGGHTGRYTVFRGTTSGTNLGSVNGGFSIVGNSGSNIYYDCSFNYLDSPSTTSSQTYTIAMRTENSNSAIYFCSGGAKAVLTLMEVAG